MNPLPAPKVPGNTEFERFDYAVRKVFSPENLTTKSIAKPAPKKRAKRGGQQ
jgi:hypothetical protein